MLAALAIASVTAPPALSEDWPNAGPYEISEGAGGCGAFTEYSFDGRSDVRFRAILFPDRFSIGLHSLDWTKPASDVEVTFGFLDREGEVTRALSGPVTPTTIDGIYDGFSTGFQPNVLDTFAAANALLVMQGDTVITHIGLRGSSLAAAALRRCLESVQRRADTQARAEKRWEYIEADPFAKPPARPATAPRVRWARQIAPGFPERARERGITSGTVALSCSVNDQGTPSDCSVVSESPTGAGFGQAALRAARSGRTAPAHIGETITYTVDFKIDP